MCAIAQHFGRPGTPTDQAWIESLFSHIKADWPHLDQIRDPAVLRAELARVRHAYNTQRLHAGIGYVTPDDEHEGRGPAIRHARRAGLHRARRLRIAYHRGQRRPEDSRMTAHGRPAPGQLACRPHLPISAAQPGCPGQPDRADRRDSRSDARSKPRSDALDSPAKRSYPYPTPRPPDPPDAV